MAGKKKKGVVSRLKPSYRSDRETCLRIAAGSKMGSAGAASRGYPGVVASARIYFGFVEPGRDGAGDRLMAVEIVCGEAGPAGVRADLACKMAAEYVAFLGGD